MPERPVMTIAALQDILDTSFPDTRVPYVIEELSATTVRMRLAVEASNSRPGGTVSGPSLMAFADCAAWMVIMGQIGPIALSVTTSFHIDFLRRPELVDVTGVATLLKLGRRLAVAEVAMCSIGSQDLVAKAQVTYSIPPS
jgi:acyl-coenzyme A thioesterase PaaI-like protein